MEAWKASLTLPSLVEGETFLRDQLWDQPQLDLLGLSELQKAYFGLSGVSYNVAASGTSRSAIDEVDATGRTILSWASQKGDDTIVAELLACGTDPNITDSYGMSCLHFAVLGSDENCVRLPLASKADMLVENSDGRTPLAYAAKQRLGVFKVLLEFGADMETQDRAGWRPIHFAVWFHQVQNVRHLIHEGADMFARTSYGTTALDFAIRHNAHRTLRVMLDPSAQLTSNVASDVNLTYAAWHADQKALEILHSAILRGFHLEMRMKDETDTNLLEIAEYRRDNNQDWSDTTLKPLDADPLAWFNSFEVLLQAIQSSQSRISEANDDERQSQLGNDEEEGRYDIDSDDETEDEESWENEHAQFAHDAGEASSDTASDDGTENEESWEDARES